MARLYGRLREAFHWRNAEIDGLSMTEAEEIVEHWKEEPTVGDILRSYFQIGRPRDKEAPAPDSTPDSPRELTEAEWQRMCAAEQAFADRHGSGR